MGRKHVKISLGKQVLDGFFELHGLTPEFDLWNYEDLEDNPPRLIRYFRLQALFRALKIDYCIKKFIYGEFISENIRRYNKSILYRVADLSKDDSLPKRKHLPHIFNSLLSYREKCRKIITINDGYLSIGEMSRHSYMITEQVNIKISRLMKPIDELLELLINPTGLYYTEERLIQCFGYPSDDLEEIDLEWT